MLGRKQEAGKEKVKIPHFAQMSSAGEWCVDRKMILHIKGNIVYLYRTALSEPVIKKKSKEAVMVVNIRVAETK